jgi:hypothetical protein
MLACGFACLRWRSGVVKVVLRCSEGVVKGLVLQQILGREKTNIKTVVIMKIVKGITPRSLNIFERMAVGNALI